MYHTKLGIYLAVLSEVPVYVLIPCRILLEYISTKLYTAQRDRFYCRLNDVITPDGRSAWLDRPCSYVRAGYIAN